ncbi:MAG: virulence-related protein [Tissierellia bacterium]|nr:virulence-related protein [Tissierellia bacterium]
MERKEIVKRLSEHLCVKARYLGPPNFDYEIKTESDTYIINRYGAVIDSKGRVINLDEILNSPKPEVKANEKLGLISTEHEEVLTIEGLELKLPLGDHTGRTLQNLVNMISSKQHLIMMAFETSVACMDKEFAKDLAEKDINTIEDFKIAFHELGTERCPGIIFDIEERTFTIKLTAENLIPERISAFQHLIVLLSESAKAQKRASFKLAQDDNPKYAMRTWLIRLGMGGQEFKNIRKILLSALSGNGAFRKVHEEEETNG